MMSVAISFLIAASSAFPMRNIDHPQLDAYDVVWNTPSVDAAGSMPIGNGEVVLNVWVEAQTGDLLFYVARSDALSEICRVLKLGAVRVHFDSHPFKDASDFRQHLRLRDGKIEISGGGAHLVLFVDSGSNSVEISGTTSNPTGMTASVECWRNEARTIAKPEQHSAWTVHDAPFQLVESGDVFTPTSGTCWKYVPPSPAGCAPAMANWEAM
jgi:alpha-L-fucosidase 2